MSFGAFWVAMAAAITAPWNYTLIRFFIGCAGATFVTNQFWCSLMFAPNVVGTANATAAGWGNLGGGVTQIFMMSVLFNPMVASGMEPNVAWRVSMVVPAVMFVVCAICMKLMCWDMPTARNYDPTVTGKTQKPSMWDYVEVLRDVRVVVMIFQYSACFGTELAMNNQLATHFRTYFQMDAGDASALAGAFGLMNLFARSLGGISSDICYKYFGFRGRIWAQFLALFFEAIFLFSFGNVDNSQPWYVALAVLVCFSLFVQMAEGTSYGIVPFMNRRGPKPVVRLGHLHNNNNTNNNNNNALYEQEAARSGVRACGCRRKPRGSDCRLLLLQADPGCPAAFPGPCGLCDVLGAAEPLLLLVRDGWDVPRTGTELREEQDAKRRVRVSHGV